jgi:mannose-1-phosphate guanylyltransferase
VIDTAIILAAGLGTRLAPLSRVRAKAALPIGGEALIRRQIRWLAAAGVARVVVNLHHLPATITGRLGHGDDLGVTVRYSWEPVVLGSAGGPRQAFELLEAERAFIVNGDMVTDANLAALADAHRRYRPLVTMAAIDPLPGYNALTTNASGAMVGVTAWRGAMPTTPREGRHGHFIGVQVAERAAFDGAPAATPSETLKWLYPRLVAADADSVRVWHSGASYYDIGSPADYLKTALAMTSPGTDAVSVLRGGTVHPTATIEASVLWDRVVVGAGATVRGCVLTDDVVVPEGLTLVDAAVVPRSGLMAGLPGRAVGDLWVSPMTTSAG